MPRVTKVEITEDRSDSLIPPEYRGTEKVSLADNGDMLDDLWLSKLDAPAPVTAEPTARKRHRDAPRLSADDRDALVVLHAVLNTASLPEEPVDDMGWVLNG